MSKNIFKLCNKTSTEYLKYFDYAVYLGNYCKSKWAFSHKLDIIENGGVSETESSVIFPHRRPTLDVFGGHVLFN